MVKLLPIFSVMETGRPECRQACWPRPRSLANLLDSAVTIGYDGLQVEARNFGTEIALRRDAFFDASALYSLGLVV